MARILTVWEIGDGHGHIRNLLATSELLRAVGHQVIFAIPALQVTAAKLIEAQDWPVERVLLPPNANPTQYLPHLVNYRAASFLDVLGLFAFDSADRLSPILARYRMLLRDNHIDLVLSETAPVATCAARIAGIPCIGVGTSFGLPELRYGFEPYPQFDHWPNTPIFSDETLVTNVNASVSSKFQSMTQVMETVSTIPYCYPAMDHYGHQRSLLHRGVGPVWKLDRQKPVTELQGFAYLQQSYPAINELISAIRKSGIPFHIFVRNGKYLDAGNMRVLHNFDLNAELRQASFVLHHGSAGISQAALSAGIPQMCCPYHIENTNNAYRLQSLGVSKAVGHQQVDDFLSFLLEQTDNRLEAAQIVAEQLKDHANEFFGAKIAASAVEDYL